MRSWDTSPCYQPRFYRDAIVSPGPEREQASRECEKRYLNIGQCIINRYPEWGDVLTTQQINSFLQEDFLKGFGGDQNLPDGFHDLRLEIIGDHIRLGCRYGQGWRSTILNVELKMWLVADEVNLVAMEITTIRAGAIPVSPQLIMNHITDEAHRMNIDVTWYRNGGNPVAILKLQADQVRPNYQLQRFELQEGKMVIVGRSLEAAGAVASPAVMH